MGYFDQIIHEFVCDIKRVLINENVPKIGELNGKCTLDTLPYTFSLLIEICRFLLDRIRDSKYLPHPVLDDSIRNNDVSRTNPFLEEKKELPKSTTKTEKDYISIGKENDFSKKHYSGVACLPAGMIRAISFFFGKHDLLWNKSMISESFLNCANPENVHVVNLIVVSGLIFLLTLVTKRRAYSSKTYGR